jgi:SH3 domain protein
LFPKWEGREESLLIQMMRDVAMNRIAWVVFSLSVICSFSAQRIATAETMYVTDQLYLAVREAPDLELPSVAVLPSDTEVEILERSNDWTRVSLADGRTGWVMEKYLVQDVPKSRRIEALQRDVETQSKTIEGLNKQIKEMSLEIEELTQKAESEPVATEESREHADTLLLIERLQEENASLRGEVSELETSREAETAMKRHIEELEKKLAAAAGGKTRQGSRIIYVIGIGALLVGLVVGYLVKKPDKNRYYLR